MVDGDLDLALDAARRGEEPGFSALWRALQPAVLRYLQAMVGEAAEDVASEAWLSAAREVRVFRGDAAGFRVWLFRVARHRALDELRRSRSRKEDNGDVAVVFAQRAGLDDTAAEAVERLTTDRALALIAALPKDQAEAVLLRVVGGLDVAQTAQVLGKRDGAVRVAAMRGLRRLAGFLADERAAEAAKQAGSAEGGYTGTAKGDGL